MSNRPQYIESLIENHRRALELDAPMIDLMAEVDQVLALVGQRAFAQSDRETKRNYLADEIYQLIFRITPCVMDSPMAEFWRSGQSLPSVVNTKKKEAA